MLITTSSNPAIQAYKVYHLSQTKLVKECRRQIPDLHRIVLHASIVDNVRRWSRDMDTPAETVVVDSDSHTDNDPFEDSSSSDEETEDGVAIFDIEVDDDTTIDQAQAGNGKVTYHVEYIENKDHKEKFSAPKRKAPAPSSQIVMKTQAWKQNRPVLVWETAIEVDGDD